MNSNYDSIDRSPDDTYTEIHACTVYILEKNYEETKQIASMIQ